MFLDNATRIEGKKTKILLDPYELKMFKGESYEGVLGVLVTRPRARLHGQGHSQHDQEVEQEAQVSFTSFATSRHSQNSGES